MKIVTSAALVILNITSALSQISITAGDMQAMWAVGKSWRVLLVANTNTTSMNVGTASSSAQSWAFPAATFSDTVRQDNMLPSATPYANLYKSATHAQKTSIVTVDGSMLMYSFFRVTTDSLIQLGSVTRAKINGRDTTLYDIEYHAEFTFPWTIGKSITWRDSIDAGGGAYMVSRHQQTADGYGSLTLPVGTFQALRLKNILYSDTYVGGVIIARDSNVTVDWITKEGCSMSVTPMDMRSSSGTIPISTYSYTTVITTPSAVADLDSQLPMNIELCQNYPNPFNPTTQIEFSIPQSSHVTLKIYDVLGKEVATLVEGAKDIGTYATTWNAQNSPSGVYFYRLTAGSYTITRKLLLLR